MPFSDRVSRRRVLAACGTALAGCLAPARDRETTGARRTEDPAAASGPSPDDAGSPDAASTPVTAAGRSRATDTAPSTPRGIRLGDGATWPTGGFDRANTGYNPETATPGDPDLRWRSRVAGIYTLPAPALVDGTLYVGTGTYAYAFDAARGRRRWQVPLGRLAHHFAPTVADGRVYVVARTLDGINGGGGAGALHALDADSGRERWAFDAPITSRPMVADGRVYVASSTADRGRLHALDAATGRERWTVEFDRPSAVFAAPSIAGDRLYAGVTRGADDPAGRLVALATDDGAVEWTVAVDGEVEAAPVIADGGVHAATVPGRVHARSLGGDERWSVDVDGGVYTTPAAADGRLFVLADGDLVALATDSGTRQWHTAVGSTVINGVARAGDAVYVGGRELTAVGAGDGSERWTYPIPGAGGAFGAPIVAGGAVFVGACIKSDPADRYDDHLYALA